MGREASHERRGNSNDRRGNSNDRRGNSSGRRGTGSDRAAEDMIAAAEERIEISSGAPRKRARPAYFPEAPRSLEELEIPEGLLIDIALRHVNNRGIATIQLLANLMKLPLELTESLYRRLIEQQFLEVRRMSGDDYVFALSASGRKVALERSASCRYAGPVPVSLKYWRAAVRAQSAEIDISRDKLRNAFHDIVVPDELLDAIGPALISQNAIFLYGESGAGKTTIAERLMRIFDDVIVTPWAVEADGQIITVADPVVHEPADFDNRMHLDTRWLVCKRPLVAAGGELVTSMLDLQKDDATGTYTAPLQMKASNGMLLIDDFGRQTISPRDMLNRWIVPLDRRVDFLSLGSGLKIDIPFELQVVFSTNLSPHELADAAFLRRIPNKILVNAATPAQFDRIFEMNTKAMKMTVEEGAAEYLRELCLRHSPDLRPCYPRDICNIIRAIKNYERREPAIARTDLERAVASYFL